MPSFEAVPTVPTALSYRGVHHRSDAHTDQTETRFLASSPLPGEANTATGRPIRHRPAALIEVRPGDKGFQVVGKILPAKGD